jgi:hypothetical protein
LSALQAREAIRSRGAKFIAANVGLAPVPSSLGQEAPEVDPNCQLWRFDNGDAFIPLNGERAAAGAGPEPLVASSFDLAEQLE